MEKAMKNEWKSNEMRSIGHWPIDLRWRSIGRWPIDLRLTAAARSQWSAAGWPLKINGKALKNQGNGACKRQMAATKWQWLPFAKWQPLPFAIDLRRNRPPQWSARGGALRSASLHAYRLSSACTRTGKGKQRISIEKTKEKQLKKHWKTNEKNIENQCKNNEK